MESFCPLCAKSGIKRRIKAFQINLDEAVLACEAKECSWPIGYEDLTFFNRSAISCNWEEPSPTKEDVPSLIELSLYTPPVTPGGELAKELTEIASTEYLSNPPEDKVETLPQREFISSKESTDKSLLFESLELDSTNSTEENRSIKNEQIADVNIFKTLPKITNIEKTNFNLTIYSNIDEHCNNRTIRENRHSLVDASIMNIFDISDSAYTEFGLNMQYKTEGEQNKSGKLQSDVTVNDKETNVDMETIRTLVDVDITNSLSTTNEGTLQENISDLNALWDDIINNENIHVNSSDDDWLNLLLS